ncbi:MAG: hypothetical protein V7L25_06320 [Nostoc sp.]
MFIFTVTSDTFLKVRPSGLAELAEDEKLRPEVIGLFAGILPLQ